MFQKILENVLEDSGECSRRFREIFEKIPGNVQEDSGETNFRFILWNLAYLYQILQLNWDRTKEYFLRYYLLLLITNLLRLNTVFLPPFFLSLFFLLSRKECNYCAQVQGYQKILKNHQLRHLKNKPQRVGTINLKLEN